MKTKYSLTASCLPLLLLTAACMSGFSQNNCVVLNGAYANLNGGTSGTPIYMVVNQSSNLGIARLAGGGHIISEGQFNLVRWASGATNASYVYPFGYSTTDYLPFTFNKTAGTSTVTVSTWATNNANVPLPGASNVAAVIAGTFTYIGSAIDRFWDIQATATADLTFSYRGAENTTAVPTDNFQAQHWDGGGWNPPVGPGNAGVTSPTVGTVGPVVGQTTFSPWVLARANAPLPVELLYFNAIAEHNSVVRCEWSTASEINNDYFGIERSKDAVNFEQIGQAPSAAPGGNSSTTLNYVRYDDHPYNGVSYYRLRQVDKNGTFAYSPVRQVYIGTFNIITIYPNPSADYIQYLVGSEKGDNVQVRVWDVLGQNVLREQTTIEGGITMRKISVANLASGMYMLQVITSSKEYAQKQFVVK